MRTASIARKTNETDIDLSLNLDGSGACRVSSGIGFFDHMMELFARHGNFDLELTCSGDLNVDSHHSVEDMGICLGQAIAQALGDKRQITRYADLLLPMDEALVQLALDVSGRSFLHIDCPVPTQQVGEFQSEMLEEFFYALTSNAGITLHINLLYGKNAHHIIEAVFKGFARTLRKAVSIDPNITGVPSTKGTLG